MTMRAAAAGTVLLASCLASPALADRWVFVNADEIKFGHQVTGSNGFDTIWFQCDGPGRLIAANATYGERRPRSGEVTATLTRAGSRATLSGFVGEEFDGVYAIEAKVSPDDQLFGMLRSGQPIGCKAAGWTRPRLSSTGQKAATEGFLAACR